MTISHGTKDIVCAGLGNRLRGVLKLALESESGSDLRITGFYDPDPTTAENSRDIAPDAVSADSWEDLLRSSAAPWAAVGSWNCFHSEQVVAALEAGKNVFCEKPLATNLDDCLAVADALRAHPDRQFFFGLVLRYSPHYQKIHELLEQGAIGRLVSVEFNETLAYYHGGYIHGNWRRHRKFAGTHLLEKCCHDFDLANWLINSVPVRAASFGGLDFFTPENEPATQALGNGANGRPAYEQWWRPGDITPFTADKDIVDNQVAILQYANGVRATFHTNCNAGIPERRMYLCGTTGAIRADVLTGEITLQRIGPDQQPERIETGSSGGHGGADHIMCAALADSIVTGKEPLAGITEALHSAIACFGVDEALDSGKVVDLMPLWERAGISP